ncbi:hypothetical protein CLAIMM_12393 [Cladophialophora immunda]|nr:hypothetical protein CLAIMM_12393 [Cladophialophora immunda]
MQVKSATDEKKPSGQCDLVQMIPMNGDIDPQTVPTVLSTTISSTEVSAPVHSVFTSNRKRFIVFMASWAGFFSAVSANIYFPALNRLSRDLHVSDTLINLTLTSYMIFQGLTPAFMGDFADFAGRRPAYTVCFTIYIAANIGLALQNSFTALFMLRCMQSGGSSATIAMSSGIVSDIATAAERGSYMGYTQAGLLLGPAIGPVIGGLLAARLGWRAIFWFLRQAARNQVGNGSIPPKGWNMCLMDYLALRKSRSSLNPNTRGSQGKIKLPNPLRSLYIIYDKENALLLFYNAFLFAAFYDVTAAIPSQFTEIFGFDELQIGLCYIPFGIGSMSAALINGQLLDRNFARWCKKLGVPIRKGRDQDLSHFPIEKARLQIALVAVYSTCVFVSIFGWLIHFECPLAPVLVVLYFSSLSMSLASNVTSTLLVDFYPRTPATAIAANNFVRCILGAGATSAVVPMINAWGRGWTFTFLTLFLVTASPMLWLLYFRGMKWRTQRRQREEKVHKETGGEAIETA